MGTDIRPIVQYRVDGKWRSFELELYSDRNYRAYALLAGICDGNFGYGNPVAHIGIAEGSGIKESECYPGFDYHVIMPNGTQKYIGTCPYWITLEELQSCAKEHTRDLSYHLPLIESWVHTLEEFEHEEMLFGAENVRVIFGFS